MVVVANFTSSQMDSFLKAITVKSSCINGNFSGSNMNQISYFKGVPCWGKPWWFLSAQNVLGSGWNTSTHRRVYVSASTDDWLNTGECWRGIYQHNAQSLPLCPGAGITSQTFTGGSFDFSTGAWQIIVDKITPYTDAQFASWFAKICANPTLLNNPSNWLVRRGAEPKHPVYLNDFGQMRTPVYYPKSRI